MPQRLQPLFPTAPVTLACAIALLGALSPDPAWAQDRGAYDAERCLPGPARGALPAGWSARRRMVHAVVCEWAKFGFPTAVVREVPDDRTNRLPGELALSEPLSQAVPPSAPPVPGVRRAVEVQVRFGRSESDLSVYDRVAAYWSATSPGYARAAEAARRERPRQPPGWWVAWSAAFTSWALKGAGVGWITPDDNHTAYLRSALTARPGSVVTIDRFRPQAGDLVCFPRLATEGEADERAAPVDFLARVRSGPPFPAHCDVVVRRNKGSLVVIGGQREERGHRHSGPAGSLRAAGADERAALDSGGEPGRACRPLRADRGGHRPARLGRAGGRCGAAAGARPRLLNRLAANPSSR